MTPDPELLRRYAEENDEAAFAELVQRYVGLVYATALRLLNNNTALAEDATQSVFTDLARKAATLHGHHTITGWLHTGARYAATHLLRKEQSQRKYEQEASTMNETTVSPEDTSWAQLRPLLDQEMGQLNEIEREALLLRYFQEKSYREVGAIVGLNENAARMRVERALEKLHGRFVSRGVTTTAAALVATLGAQAASIPAPAGLAAKVTSLSLLAAEPHAVLANTLKSLFKNKIILAATSIGVLSIAVIALVAPSHPKKSFPPTPAPTAPAKPSQSAQPDIKAPAIPRTGILAVVLATAAPVAVAATTTPVADEVTTAATTTQNENPSTPEVKPIPATVSYGIAAWIPTEANAAFKNNTAPANGVVRTTVWTDSQIPTLLDMSAMLQDNKTITAIASAGTTQTALLSDGTVWTWHSFKPYNTYNSQKKLVNTVAPGDSPVMVPLQNPDGPQFIISSISASAMTLYPVSTFLNTSYGISTEGILYRWSDIRTLDPKMNKYLDAVPYAEGTLAGKKVTALAAGKSHVLALCTDGVLVAWGNNEFGSLGIGPAKAGAEQKFYPPTPVNNKGALAGKKITAIAAGGVASLALCGDGTLYQWGGLENNGRGVILAGNKHVLPYTITKIPQPVNTQGVLKGKSITKIAVSGMRNLVLCADGTLATFGTGEASPVRADGSHITDLKDYADTEKAYLTPALVDTSGALAGKTVKDITGDAGGFMILCSDGTLGMLPEEAMSEGSRTPIAADSTGVLNGKTILAIAPGMALYK